MPRFPLRTLSVAITFTLLQGCIYISFLPTYAPIDEEEQIFGLIIPGKTQSKGIFQKISTAMPSSIIGGDDEHVSLLGCFQDKYPGDLTVQVNSYKGIIQSVVFTFGEGKFKEYTDLLNARYGKPLQWGDAEYWRTSRGIVKMTKSQSIGTIEYVDAGAFQVAWAY